MQWVCQKVIAAAPPQPPTFHVANAEQVFVADRSGGARRLTHGREHHFTPVWSHSGLRIAASGEKRITILSLDGRVRGRISTGGLFAGPVAWGPDDHRVAFVSFTTRTGHYPFDGKLVVADVDGGHRRVVARGVDGQPAWSADGSTLFYKRGRREAYRAETLWARPVRGGEPRRLASGVHWDSRVLASPDGAHVLFRHGEPASERGLWIVNPDGSGLRRLIGSPSFDACSYGWLRGGRAVFGGKAPGSHPIVTSLSGRRRVAGAKVQGCLYDWSSDGRRLAWLHHGSRTTAVRSARPDGGDLRTHVRFEATNNPVDVDTVSLSPDGRRIAVDPFRHIGD